LTASFKLTSAIKGSMVPNFSRPLTVVMNLFLVRYFTLMITKLVSLTLTRFFFAGAGTAGTDGSSVFFSSFGYSVLSTASYFCNCSCRSLSSSA
jgi:hypothetical protein